MTPPRVSAEHVIWAYKGMIVEWFDLGASPSAIRLRLREEWSLHVGVEAVKAVLRASGRRK